MQYDGANPLHAQQARAKVEKFIKDKKIFDLTEKSQGAVIKQTNIFTLSLRISVRRLAKQWNMSRSTIIRYS